MSAGGVQVASTWIWKAAMSSSYGFAVDIGVLVFVECDVPLVLVFGCVGSAGLAVSTRTYEPIQPIIDCGDTQLKVYGPGSEAPTTCQPAQMKLVQSNCVNWGGGVNVPH